MRIPKLEAGNGFKNDNGPVKSRKLPLVFQPLKQKIALIPLCKVTIAPAKYTSLQGKLWRLVRNSLSEVHD